jgi:cation-transporting ATPase E
MTPLGLTTSEANARRAAGQGNNVKLKESRTYLDIVLSNLFNFINSILFVLGFALLLLGRTGDAVASSGLVLINVVVGVFQEARAKQTLDRIALLSRPKAGVMRDGAERQLDPSEIVLGDIIHTDAGDQIVVDGKVIAPDNARMDVDESLLTGESDLVVKRGGDPVYSGSFCVSGSVYYEATKVGGASLANQITAGARQFRTIKTPLQREIELVLRVLMLVVAQLGLLFTISNIIFEVSLVESLQIAAIIAGLVPNGLILMTTVAYAMGAVRMAGKGALVQQSNAIESLSNVNVLCLDKTGTLTANRIYLKDVLPIHLSESELKKLLGDYAANLTSQNRTSEAIAESCKGEKKVVKQEASFSSAHKWSGLMFADGGYVLGAPEILRQATLLEHDQEKYIEERAAQGLRVLLFAGVAASTPLLDSQEQPHLPASITPLGLVSFGDELRLEAKETLAGFTNAGVQLKIISGDNPQTVAALAKQAGLGADIKLVSGLELDQMSDEDFKRAANEATIFGRITPQQKEKLVRALRDAGNYVAMIGDGVNDVLSLKQAQLGIAMQSGSQAARGVADIILLNDSFAALLPAVREGQRIVNGMQDIIRLFLSRTAYVTFLIAYTGIVGAYFPFVPKQNSLAAFITVGLPTFWLAVWARPGRHQRNLLRSVLHFILPASFTIALAAFSVYLFYLLKIPDEALAIDTARTAMQLVVILCGLCLIVFVEPPVHALAGGDDYSGDWRPALLALFTLIVLVVIMFVEPFRNAFDMVALAWTDYLLIVCVAAVWAGLVMLIWRKKVLFRFLNIEI